MKLRDAILAETLPLPPIPQDLAYQFVIAGNGTFIRAEDSRIEAMVPVAYAHVHGLAEVEPYAWLKVHRVPARWLKAALKSAREKLPNEAMYLLLWTESDQLMDLHGWRCVMPAQTTDPASIAFEDANTDAVIDLHSHGTLGAFFSETDDRDEQGLRFYVVIGHIDEETPGITARAGVYGHHWTVDPTEIFDCVDGFEPVYFYEPGDPRCEPEEDEHEAQFPE